MTPTPEQLAKWCKEALSFYIRTPIDPNRTGHSHYYTDGYLRAKTEQASEIAALKTQVAELMPLAKFGAVVAISYVNGDKFVPVHELDNLARDYGVVDSAFVFTSDTKTTIEQLLKE